MLLLPLGAALAWHRRHDSTRAAHAALAVGVAFLIALPVLARNQVLFGNALYPAFATDLDPALYRLHLERYGLPAGAFYGRAVDVLGRALVAVALAGAITAWFRRRIGVEAGLLLFGFGAVLMAPLLPAGESTIRKERAVKGETR